MEHMYSEKDQSQSEILEHVSNNIYIYTATVLTIYNSCPFTSIDH